MKSRIARHSAQCHFTTPVYNLEKQCYMPSTTRRRLTDRKSWTRGVVRCRLVMVAGTVLTTSRIGVRASIKFRIFQYSLWKLMPFPLELASPISYQFMILFILVYSGDWNYQAPHFRRFVICRLNQYIRSIKVYWFHSWIDILKQKLINLIFNPSGVKITNVAIGYDLLTNYVVSVCCVVHGVVHCVKDVFRDNLSWQKYMEIVNNVTKYFNYHTEAYALLEEQQLQSGVSTDRLHLLNRDITTRWHSRLGALLT